MRVSLIDGTFELYRAHYSPRPSRSNAHGDDIKASLGLCVSLRRLLQDEAKLGPVHIAVAFDNPIASFRNQLFDGYKSDAGVPDELRRQFDHAERAVAAMGVTVWSMSEFEADDAIASAAAALGAGDHEVRLLSPDKDLGQCLGPAGVVQVDRIRQKEWGAAGVREKFGIEPLQIPDYLALVGDAADGVPGIAGIGAKAAASLLSAFGSLDQIPERAAEWPREVRGRDKLAAALSAQREQALLYRTLTTLRRDVPLHTTAEALRHRGELEANWAEVERLLDAPLGC